MSLFEPGFRFATGYRIDKFLGRGQFGQVWSVQSPGGTLAAVKFIDLSETNSKKEFEGIKRIKQIRQANLMPITAIWQLDEHGRAIDLETASFLLADKDKTLVDPSSLDAAEQTSIAPSWLAVAMLLGGKSLQSLLLEAQADGLEGIPPSTLISYMQDAAKGLDFLNQPIHDLGEGLVAIQHCDVKPANIVTLGNSAVICDFGLAKILHNQQATATSAAGTPAFMAPEAIEGAPGRTSDQYSLAITYYQLLTGRLPAEGKSVWEIIDKHRQGKLSFIGVNPAERSVLVKATDVDWTRRYNSCADLVDHLRDAHRLRAEGDSHPASSPDAWRAEDAGAMQTSDFDAASPTKSNTAAQAAANLDTQIAGAPIAHAESKVSHQANFPIQTLDAGPRAIAIDAPQAWRRFLKPAAIIGSLSFCALFAAWTVSGWFRPEALPSVDDSGTSKNSTLENNSGQVERATLASALALFHSDETRAIAEFQRFLASTARTADARECPTTLISGTDSLEALWFIGDQMLLTLGYQPAPMLHLLPSTLTEKTQSISLPRIGSPVYPQAIALTAERRHLLVGGSPPLTVWELQSLRADNLPQPLEVSSIEGEIVAAAWHPQLPVAVAMDDSGSLRVFEFDNHSVKRSSSFEVAWIAQTLCSDVDAKYLIATTVDGDVRRLLWSDILETFELPHTPDDPSIKPAGTIARVLAPLRIGEESLVAVGDTQGTLTLWRLQIDSQWFARTDAHLGPIESLSVSKTNTSILQSVVVSSDSDGGVFVWQPETAASTTRRFGTEPITSTAISKDSRWIVAATRGGVWLWQWTLREDNVVYRVDCGTALVMNVGLDSANNILAAVCDDGSTRLWDFRHLCLLASTTPTLDLPQIPAPKMDHPGVGGKITKTEPKGFPLPTPVFSAIQ